jgi:cell division septation protein DedD
MRNLCLGLVLANLAFAAWSAWFAPTERAAGSPDDGLPALILVSEVPPDLRSSSGDIVEQPQAASNETSASAPGDVSSADPSHGSDEAGALIESAEIAVLPSGAIDAVVPVDVGCTSVGPFRELSQAAAAAATLRGAGYQPVQRVGEGDVWIGYWVYLPAIATEQEANDILARVRAEGIADSYVIPNSDSGNLVSLGVFSEISGVSRRRDQVRALGYEPQVVDRTRRATVYWVDVALASDQVLDFDALQPPGRIIRLEQRPCEATR